MIFAAASFAAGSSRPQPSLRWRDLAASLTLVLTLGALLVTLETRGRRAGQMPQQALQTPPVSAPAPALQSHVALQADFADEPSEPLAHEEALRAELLAFALSKVARQREPAAAAAPAEPPPAANARAKSQRQAQRAKATPVRRQAKTVTRFRQAEWPDPLRAPQREPQLWERMRLPRVAHYAPAIPAPSHVARNAGQFARGAGQRLSATANQVQRGAGEAARAVTEPVARLLR
ncbi:MAG: hypothetical protein FJX29_07370 [Alphaproteobacteria bacterium]|nr:hypothetical protein [Alphaproteobacteria bacterium]